MSEMRRLRTSSAMQRVCCYACSGVLLKPNGFHGALQQLALSLPNSARLDRRQQG